MKTKRFNRRVSPYLYLLPSVAVLVGLLAYPLFFNLYVSIHKWELSSPKKPFIGLDNYKALITDDLFLKVLITTLIWTIVGVFLQMVLGLLTALYIDGKRKGQTFLRTLLLLPWVIPGVVTALIWSWMLQYDLGIVNYILKSLHVISGNVLWLGSPSMALGTLILVNTWKAFPFWFLMILAGLQSISQDQIEAAKMDGARWFSIARHIKIPHLMPIIGSTGVVTTIWTLNYFDLIWTTTQGGPLDSTTTLPIYTYRLAFEFFDFGKSSAMAIITLVIIGIVCLPYIRAMLKSIKE
jgi:multiple sugar transport system permease protein